MEHTFNLSLTARDDGTLEAAYVQLVKAKAARTRELLPSVLLVDFDDEDNLIGVEILAPVKISTVHKIADSLEGAHRDSFNRFIDTYAPKSLVTCG